jgi:hypothetical protein
MPVRHRCPIPIVGVRFDLVLQPLEAHQPPNQRVRHTELHLDEAWGSKLNKGGFSYMAGDALAG